eukprot:TRINITY_DN8686_c0_g1_i1.p1 TRINITY_DN8686_c0_g1~~TRINITY_DN8686_c0_g1_i1.p1  ORF type:complete len:1647 (-),score=527.88 TRINITY_DN8686_c0_g1_i1:40-4980(-)
MSSASTLTLLCLLLAVVGTQAVTYYADSTGTCVVGDCSDCGTIDRPYRILDQAVNCHRLEDDVEIIVETGTYPFGGSGIIRIQGKNMVIRSNNGPVTVLPQAGDLRFLRVERGGDVSVTGFEFADVNEDVSSGGVFVVDGTELLDEAGARLRLTDCKFNNCQAPTGAVAYVTEDGILELVNCEFTNNFGSDGVAGVFHLKKGSIAATSCTFTGNSVDTSTDGPGSGGVAFLEESSTGFFNDCTFTSNSAQDGGVFYVDDDVLGGSDLTVTESVFTDNTAVGFGGALYYFGRSLGLVNSQFVTNTASAGGAIWMGNIDPFVSTPVFLRGLLFEGNQASAPANGADGGLNDVEFNGGAIFSERGLDILDCTFRNNVVTGGNGGALHVASSLKAFDTIFEGNTAVGNFGGAISAIGLNSSPVILDKCTVRGNSALDGGALYTTNPALTVKDTAFDNNNATRNGGALYESADGLIDGGVFSNNNAVLGGAVYTGGHLNLQNAKFDTNVASMDGGALACISQPSGLVEKKLNIIGTSFVKSSAANNGGAVWSTCDTTITDSIFDQSTTGVTGGAYYCDPALRLTADCLLTVRGSTFSNSVAASAGAFDANGEFLVETSSFSYGSSVIASGPTTFTQCDFSFDSFLTSNGDLTVINGCSFSDNSFVDVNGADLSVTDSSFARNSDVLGDTDLVMKRTSHSDGSDVLATLSLDLEDSNFEINSVITAEGPATLRRTSHARTSNVIAKSTLDILDSSFATDSDVNAEAVANLSRNTHASGSDIVASNVPAVTIIDSSFSDNSDITVATLVVERNTHDASSDVTGLSAFTVVESHFSNESSLNADGVLTVESSTFDSGSIINGVTDVILNDSTHNDGSKVISAASVSIENGKHTLSSSTTATTISANESSFSGASTLAATDIVLTATDHSVGSDVSGGKLTVSDVTFATDSDSIASVDSVFENTQHSSGSDIIATTGAMSITNSSFDASAVKAEGTIVDSEFTSVSSIVGNPTASVLSLTNVAVSGNSDTSGFDITVASSSFDGGSDISATSLTVTNTPFTAASTVTASTASLTSTTHSGGSSADLATGTVSGSTFTSSPVSSDVSLTASTTSFSKSPVTANSIDFTATVHDDLSGVTSIDDAATIAISGSTFTKSSPLSTAGSTTISGDTTSFKSTSNIASTSTFSATNLSADGITISGNIFSATSSSFASAPITAAGASLTSTTHSLSTVSVATLTANTASFTGSDVTATSTVSVDSSTFVNSKFSHSDGSASATVTLDSSTFDVDSPVSLRGSVYTLNGVTSEGSISCDASTSVTTGVSSDFASFTATNCPAKVKDTVAASVTLKDSTSTLEDVNIVNIVIEGSPVTITGDVVFANAVVDSDITGSGDITVNGEYDWVSGVIGGVAGSELVVSAQALLKVSLATDSIFATRSLVNAGTTTFYGRSDFTPVCFDLQDATVTNSGTISLGENCEIISSGVSLVTNKGVIALSGINIFDVDYSGEDTSTLRGEITSLDVFETDRAFRARFFGLSSVVNGTVALHYRQRTHEPISGEFYQVISFPSDYDKELNGEPTPELYLFQTETLYEDTVIIDSIGDSLFLVVPGGSYVPGVGTPDVQPPSTNTNNVSAAVSVTVSPLALIAFAVMAIIALVF